MDNGWVVLGLGLAGMVAFVAFLWMMSKGLRESAGRRMDEKEEIRQAELRRARGIDPE